MNVASNCPRIRLISRHFRTIGCDLRAYMCVIRVARACNGICADDAIRDFQDLKSP